MKRFIIATFVGLLLAGCATRSQWEGRVGKFSYDQAVLELGVPDREALLSNGMRVSEWIRSPEIYNRPLYSPDYHFNYPPTIATRVPARILRLTFGPEGRLSEWKQVRR
jgi:hypothetical protein